MRRRKRKRSIPSVRTNTTTTTITGNWKGTTRSARPRRTLRTGASCGGTRPVTASAPAPCRPLAEAEPQDGADGQFALLKKKKGKKKRRTKANLQRTKTKELFGGDTLDAAASAAARRSSNAGAERPGRRPSTLSQLSAGHGVVAQASRGLSRHTSSRRLLETMARVQQIKNNANSARRPSRASGIARRSSNVSHAMRRGSTASRVSVAHDDARGCLPAAAAATPSELLLMSPLQEVRRRVSSVSNVSLLSSVSSALRSPPAAAAGGIQQQDDPGPIAAAGPGPSAPRRASNASVASLASRHSQRQAGARGPRSGSRRRRRRSRADGPLDEKFEDEEHHQD